MSLFVFTSYSPSVYLEPRVVTDCAEETMLVNDLPRWNAPAAGSIVSCKTKRRLPVGDKSSSRSHASRPLTTTSQGVVPERFSIRAALEDAVYKMFQNRFLISGWASKASDTLLVRDSEKIFAYVLKSMLTKFCKPCSSARNLGRFC